MLFHDIWDKKCILDYGNEDTLYYVRPKNGFSVSNIERYQEVLKILNIIMN